MIYTRTVLLKQIEQIKEEIAMLVQQLYFMLGL